MKICVIIFIPIIVFAECFVLMNGINIKSPLHEHTDVMRNASVLKIACLQMNMKFACPDDNYSHVGQIIDEAAKEHPDLMVLPETWNTGFFPKSDLYRLSCTDGDPVRSLIGNLAVKHNVNIAAGSVSNLKNGRIYNTAMIFDRRGNCIAEYDKTHLFSPMGENDYFTGGNGLCTFTIDGVKCAVIICYDIRFPELARTLALSGTEILIVVSQWPRERISHLRILTQARAVENQMFVVCCNSCGSGDRTVFGGNSAVIDPLGNVISAAGEYEEIITAECRLDELTEIRKRIPVFRDRRPGLYGYTE